MQGYGGASLVQLYLYKTQIKLYEWLWRVCSLEQIYGLCIHIFSLVWEGWSDLTSYWLITKKCGHDLHVLNQIDLLRQIFFDVLYQILLLKSTFTQPYIWKIFWKYFFLVCFFNQQKTGWTDCLIEVV